MTEFKSAQQHAWWANLLVDSPVGCMNKLVGNTLAHRMSQPLIRIGMIDGLERECEAVGRLLSASGFPSCNYLKKHVSNIKV